jgi:hypothetical protein
VDEGMATGAGAGQHVGQQERVSNGVEGTEEGETRAPESPKKVIGIQDLPRKEGFQERAASKRGGRGGDGEEDDDSDDEDLVSQLALPSDVTEIDVTVLATLPPSVQFDIMQKLRDEQFNQNRLKFQVSRPRNF